MGGCCLGPVLAQNAYCPFVPYTLCADEGSTCLCIGSDCSFPCSDSIPQTCGGQICPGLMFYPKVGCCMSVAQLIGEDKFGGAPAVEMSGVAAPQGAPAAPDMHAELVSAQSALSMGKRA